MKVGGHRNYTRRRNKTGEVEGEKTHLVDISSSSSTSYTRKAISFHLLIKQHPHVYHTSSLSPPTSHTLPQAPTPHPRTLNTIPQAPTLSFLFPSRLHSASYDPIPLTQLTSTLPDALTHAYKLPHSHSLTHLLPQLTCSPTLHSLALKPHTHSLLSNTRCFQVPG